MGKGKSKEQQEVLGQIYDFIFAQAKKPVDKRKPMKLDLSGKAADNNLTEAISAALEVPGAFINDQILSNINDALTIEFGRLKADENGINKAKFTSSNIVDILSDPNKFLEKPKDAAKAMRKTMRAEFVGKSMQEFLAYGWAKKYNLDLDTRKAIEGHYAAEKIKEEAAGRAISKASANTSISSMGNSEKSLIAARRVELIGMQVFGRDGWNSMSSDRQEKFKTAVRQDSRFAQEAGKGVTTSRGEKFSYVEEYLNKTYGNNAKRAVDSYLNKVRPKGEKLELFDTKKYLQMERGNLSGRIEDMERYLASHPSNGNRDREIERLRVQEGINQLQQASVIVSNQHLNVEDVAKARLQLSDQIKDFQTQISIAKKSGNKDQEKYYMGKIKGLKDGQRMLNSMEFWGKVGKTEGFINSWKGIMGGIGAENAVGSFLSGSFFDPDANTTFTNPSVEAKITLGSHIFGTKDEDGNKFNRIEPEKIAIKVAKRVTGEDGKKLRFKILNLYNEQLVNAYYFTPGSMMRSLFVNGEGFIYMNYMKEQKLVEKLGLAGKFEALGQEFNGIDYDKLLAKDPKYLDLLKKCGLKDSAIASLTGLRKTAQIFSFGQRMRDKANAWLNEKVYKQMRQKIFDTFLKKLGGEGVQELLGEWVLKGGFETVAKALVTSALNAIGIGATGGLGTFLVPILSAIVVDVLYDGAKVLIKIGMLVLAGVIGIMVFFGGGGYKEFTRQTYAYTHVAPGEVVSNPDFQDIPDLTYEGDPGSPTTVYTGDAQAIFDQVRNEMGLNTTLKLVNCTDGNTADRAACNNIDWAWCYSSGSAATVYCRADRFSGGDRVLTNLFRHELIHQIQHCGGGLLGEWGADFLASNGGGYKFQTKDGVKRATETASYLIGTGMCTMSELQKLALGNSGNQACTSAWGSYVTGFANR